MNYEIPSFSGTPEQQLEQVRSFLFRLVERMNITESGEYAKAPVENTFSAQMYNELRDQIGKAADNIKTLDKAKVSHTELTIELENALREAEESGDFDGNGINYVGINADYSITFGFTDGTFYTTPVLNQISVGDVFTTTREGTPETLLGYGTWELITDSPIYMYKRIT